MIDIVTDIRYSWNTYPQDWSISRWIHSSADGCDHLRLKAFNPASRHWLEELTRWRDRGIFLFLGYSSLLSAVYAHSASLLAQNLAQKFLNTLGWIPRVRLRFVLVALPKQSPEHTERIVGIWHNPF
jgi:hypothetical protein